jgi:hypothetical protein
MSVSMGAPFALRGRPLVESPRSSRAVFNSGPVGSRIATLRIIGRARRAFNDPAGAGTRVGLSPRGRGKEGAVALTDKSREEKEAGFFPFGYARGFGWWEGII